MKKYSANAKAGFTLVEVVIAMAIAVLVSIMATSVSLNTNAICKQANLRFNSVCNIQNVFECYKGTGSVTNFETALNYCYEPYGNEGASPVCFVKNAVLTANPLIEARYSYSIYFNKDNNIIYITPENVALDAEGNSYCTELYSYVVIIDLYINSEAAAPYSELNADSYYYVSSDSAKPAEQIYQLPEAYRKAGAFQNA